MTKVNLLKARLMFFSKIPMDMKWRSGTSFCLHSSFLPMKFQIRSCNRDDFTSIFNLFKQLWPSLELDYAALYAVYERALSSVTQHLIVGVQEDRIVGFCSLSLKNNFWKMISTHP